MARKKKEDINTEPPSEENKDNSNNNEKYSLIELFEKNAIHPLYAVGFLEHHNLKKEFESEYKNDEKPVQYTEDEFNKMYEEYIMREI